MRNLMKNILKVCALEYKFQCQKCGETRWNDTSPSRTYKCVMGGFCIWRKTGNKS